MDYPEIDVDELERLRADNIAVVDVREPDEWEEHHLDGAISLPLGTVPSSIHQLPSDGPVYVMCAKGGRSAKAVEFLRRQGVDAVNVAGGINAWLEAGKPTASGA